MQMLCYLKSFLYQYHPDAWLRSLMFWDLMTRTRSVAETNNSTDTGPASKGKPSPVFQ